MKSLTSEVETYLATLPVERRLAIEGVHAAIVAAAPELPVKMWNKIIGYGEHHYRYASGRELTWLIVGLTNNKNYISCHLCIADENGYLAEQSKDRLGNVDVGKGCVRFKRLEDLNLDVLAELVQRSVDLVKSGQYKM